MITTSRVSPSATRAVPARIRLTAVRLARGVETVSASPSQYVGERDQVGVAGRVGGGDPEVDVGERAMTSAFLCGLVRGGSMLEIIVLVVSILAFVALLLFVVMFPVARRARRLKAELQAEVGDDAERSENAQGLRAA